MADGDAAAFVAAPFAKRVCGGLVPFQQAILNGGSGHNAGETLRAAGQLPAPICAAFIRIILKNDAPVLHDQHGHPTTFS